MKHKWAVKNVRAIGSGMMSASLYRDGKRVGTVEDDGRGGDYFYRAPDGGWLDEEVLRSLEADARTHESTAEFRDDTFGRLADIYVAALIDAFEFDKEIRRLTRQYAIVFRLRGADPNEIRFLRRLGRSARRPWRIWEWDRALKFALLQHRGEIATLWDIDGKEVPVPAAGRAA